MILMETIRGASKVNGRIKQRKEQSTSITLCCVFILPHSYLFWSLAVYKNYLTAVIQKNNVKRMMAVFFLYEKQDIVYEHWMISWNYLEDLSLLKSP
jgi:hypothetical protein